MRVSFSWILLLALTVASCSKSSQNASTQSLLQNRWVLLSESYSYPTIPNSGTEVYNGYAADFYQFNGNDTLMISQSGTIFSPGYPLLLLRKYSLINSNQIFLYGNTNIAADTLTIQKLNADSLILTSPVYFSYVDSLQHQVTATGIETITLFR